MYTSSPIKVVDGIIGETGLDQDFSILKNKKLVDLEETPFGRSSDLQAIAGIIEDVQIYIISRHGKNHNINSSNVNYRANLWTLVKQLNCTHILVRSACGSLKEHIKPRHVGILDQYIDQTKGLRQRSYYSLCHVEQKNPVDKTLQCFISEALDEEKILAHKDLTAITIEGPRFSTPAESRLWRSWGCDVVNMTSVPEVALASELDMFYASLLLVIYYDCWREDEDSIGADLVVERMKDLGSKARMILPNLIKRIADHDWVAQQRKNQEALMGTIMCD